MRKVYGIIIAMIIIASPFVLAGGQQEKDEGPVTLNILVESGGFQLQKEIAENFEAETGHTVNFVQVPYNGVYDKLTAEMAAGGGSYDIATIDVVWLPRFAEFAEPIDELFTDEVKADLFDTLIQDAQFNGHFVGMPQWANAEILFYRKDLFNDPQEKADFKAEYGYELKPPQTWQEYIDAAKFFTRDADGDGQKDMYGTDVKGAFSYEYTAHVLQAGSEGVVLDSEGNVIVDNKAHLDALKFYSGLHREHDVTPDSVVEIDWAQSQQLFYQGRTAMMEFFAHAYRMVPENAKIDMEDVGVAPMISGPGGRASIPAPWYNIIPKSSEHKDVAKQFIQYAFEQNALGIKAPLALAARKSAYEEYADKEGFEHFAPLLETLSAPQTMGRPMVKNWQEINNEALIPMLQDTLTGKKTPEEAVKWAAERISQMQ